MKEKTTVFLTLMRESCKFCSNCFAHCKASTCKRSGRLCRREKVREDDSVNICVYGASSAQLKDIYYEKTQELGRDMGKRGHGLVFGGGATGMMGAAARGVDSEDGYILGIAPRFFDKPGVLYENCSEFIFTETMRERKKLLEERSDATIVTPGGIGTYEEFFEILTLKSLHRMDRPIVLYNINGYYDGMKALLQHTADEKFMDASNMELCAFMDDPEQILAYIENYK